MLIKLLLSIIPCLTFGLTYDVKSTVNDKPMGSVTCADSRYGLLCQVDLNSLSPGPHGIHLHENNSCKNHGLAAKGHFSKNNQQHLGPYSPLGHFGDLPIIFADKNGHVQTQILAPRLKEEMIINKPLIIHSGGDNYAEKPKPLGGGGSRVACAEYTKDQT